MLSMPFWKKKERMLDNHSKRSSFFVFIWYCFSEGYFRIPYPMKRYAIECPLRRCFVYRFHPEFADGWWESKNYKTFFQFIVHLLTNFLFILFHFQPQAIDSKQLSFQAFDLYESRYNGPHTFVFFAHSSPFTF
jgi:hypothetical protein